MSGRAICIFARCISVQILVFLPALPELSNFDMVCLYWWDSQSVLQSLAVSRHPNSLDYIVCRKDCPFPTNVVVRLLKPHHLPELYIRRKSKPVAQ